MFICMGDSDVAFPEKYFAENFPEIFQKISGNFPTHNRQH